MTLYHVTLGGQGLILDLATYQKRAQPPFADKTSQGDRGYGDLFYEQVWQQASWAGGDGAGTLLDWDPASPDRFRAGTGLDGYTQPGSLRVGPDLASTSPPANNGYTVLAPFRGKLYAGTGDGKIYQLTTPATWALAHDTAKAGGVTAFAVYLGKLYAANGTDGVVASFDGTTWTATAFTSTAVSGIRAMAVFDPNQPTLYLGNSTATQAKLRRYNGSTVSADLYLPQEPDVSALVAYGGYLWAFGADSASRRGGIYRGDGTTWDRRLDLAENYVSAAIVHAGRLYLGMGAGGELWEYDGSGSPTVIANNLTASGDELRGLAVWQRALWVAGRSGTELRLRRYDVESKSWSEPCSGSSVNNAAGGTQGLASLGSDLYAAGQKSGTAAPIVRASPSGAYATATRTLETLLFTAGLGSDNKVFRGVTVNHAALASSQTIQVQYRLEDSGSWTSLGTSATVGATTATFVFVTAVGKIAALRLLLVATAGATPIVYEVLVRYAPQPPTKREWRFEARFEGSADQRLVTLDGTADPKTGPEIAAAVWSQKAANGPVTLLDLDGTSYSVWFLDLQEGPSERSQRLGLQTRGKIRLLEA